MGDGPHDGGFDAGELLAGAVEDLEAGRVPSAAAVDELVQLLREKPCVAWALRRRRSLAAFEAVRAASPGASRVTVARMVARRTGESWETVRRWAREAGPRGGGPEDG